MEQEGREMLDGRDEWGGGRKLGGLDVLSLLGVKRSEKRGV